MIPKDSYSSEIIRVCFLAPVFYFEFFQFPPIALLCSFYNPKQLEFTDKIIIRSKKRILTYTVFILIPIYTLSTILSILYSHNVIINDLLTPLIELTDSSSIESYFIRFFVVFGLSYFVSLLFFRKENWITITG